VFQPGEGLVAPKQTSTWAVYFSTWQYLYIEEPNKAPIDLLNGAPDRQGVGLFIRFGFADKDTNPVEWAVSAGVGGRGLIPVRDNDTFGIGYYYNRVQTLRLSGILGLENSAQGFECFYNIAITPACRVTLDLQVVEAVQARLQTATVVGLRAGLDF
jgi:porin